MFNLLPIMIFLPLMGCLFVLAAPNNKTNAYNVSFFTLLMNVAIILRLFAQAGTQASGLSFEFSYGWPVASEATLFFGADTFALLIILGVHLALIIGLVGLNQNGRKNKSLILLMLYFTFNMTAFLTAGDLLSFYAFFAGMLLPLFMLIGAYGNMKKLVTLYRFFMYNFAGILFLLAAALILCKFYHGNVRLSEIAVVDMSPHVGLLVWTAVCLAFISRIPVWPFHSWIASVSANIKNPLVYIMVNLMPLTGLYGFARFWPLAIPESISLYLPFIEIFTVLTMLFIALIGFVSKEFLYKLFSYSTVYYLLFLLAMILPVDTLMMNMAYSLFSFLIITSSLVILDLQFEEKCQAQTCDYRGILTYIPRFSLMMSFFVLAAVGLPISSLFWNNFILISEIFHENFTVGLWVAAALTLAALGLLHEFYVMRDLRKHEEKAEDMEDLSPWCQGFLAGMVVILFLSFFDPLWFVF